MYDILILGAGPAGLSAAVAARQKNRSVLVISNPIEGNPLYRSERVDNYLGLPGVTGRELLETYVNHAKEMGAEFVTGRVVSAMAMPAIPTKIPGSMVWLIPSISPISVMTRLIPAPMTMAPMLP